MLSVLALLATIGVTVSAKPAGHTFNVGDNVPMFVNKVGPYHNTHETYHYYSLPVCHPEKIKHRPLTLGEVLDGDRMAEALYQIKFRQDVANVIICNKTLSESDIAKFIKAIEEKFYFEFIIDDMPIRGFIGHVEEESVFPHAHKVYLFTHLDIHIQYNAEHIVGVTVQESRGVVDLSEVANKPIDPAAASSSSSSTVKFSYSVSWSENTKIPFRKRLKFAAHHDFFIASLEVHWLSIINSVVLVVLLTSFVVVILTRLLNRDFDRYSRHADPLEPHDEEGDQGWKSIHNDVFRFPNNKSLLCALIGNGTQFLILSFSIIILAVTGVFNANRHGSMNTAVFVIYSLTCCVSGFVSSRLYHVIEGQKWAWNIILTACTFAVPFFIIWSAINSLAWYQGSTQALPATTIMILMITWTIIDFPLTVLGGVIGRRNAGQFDSPCRTKNIPRELPPTQWYHRMPAQLLAGGFLPFSAISVELYYVFATIWGRDNYTIFGVLFVAFVMLLAVTACTSITLTYFQLNSENYHWWWRSLLASGFVSLYVFLYGFYFYYFRSNMSGVLQTTQFFGFTLIACFVFFLMLGTVGFVTSLTFVRYIYKNLKLD